MSKLPSSTALGLLFSIVCFGQTQPVIVPKYIRLLADSVQNAQLVNSLNGFLDQASGLNKDNAFVQVGYLPETSALLDEMKGMADAGPGKNDFYKCYLSNVEPIDSADYIVQLSYIATVESAPEYNRLAYEENVAKASPGMTTILRF